MDLISRQQAIQMLNTLDRYVANSLRLCDTDKTFPQNEVFIVDDMYESLEQLPSAEPQYHNTDGLHQHYEHYHGMENLLSEPQIVRCKDCRYYKQFGKSEWGDCLALSRICKSIDFCSWGARMETEQILSEADNDTAYGGLMSAT